MTVTADTSAPEGSGEYRDLARRVKAAGLLRRRPGRYCLRMTTIGLALVGGWAALVYEGRSWAVLAVAVFLAVVFTQVVFVGHDAGHQQIFHSRRNNRLVGLAAGNVLTGVNFGWWVPKHNAHHQHPNQVDRDPDIGTGVIAFTSEIVQHREGAARVLARWQAWLFFPLLTLEALALHVTSVRDLLGRSGRRSRIEAILLLVHATVYLGAIFWLLSPVHAIVFIAVQQGAFGLYLGCCFAPNHKGMTLLRRDSDKSFLRRQILTARNITGGPITAVAFGGLNYQIEHHLFPTMPSANLAQSQSIVRAFCLEHQLPYRECGLFRSYGEALAHLRAIGQATSVSPACVPI